jgi:stage II sporulation protein D
VTTRAAGAALALAVACASCSTMPPRAPRTAPVPPAATASPAPAPRTTPAAVPPVASAPGPLQLVGEPMIEVGLAWDLDTLSVAPGSRATLSLRRERPGRVDPEERSEGPVRFRRDGAGARATGSGGVAIDLVRGDTLWLASAVGAPRFAWGGHAWRGQAKLFVNARGTLTLAARVPLETYLVGVVPGEIGGLAEELLEAGRAQAVAARSYTLFYRGRRAAEGFDLYGTVEDQVYGAVDSERPLATRCVESTRALVALRDGQPIRANYCSTCGGVSAEVWEAWPAAAVPYLGSHADAGSADYCAASPVYRWREEWESGEFLRTVARWAPAQGVAIPPGGLGDLLDVRVDARSRSGRVWRLVVSTTNGDVVVPAYALRQVLRRPGTPGAILRSSLFKVDVRRDPVTRAARAVVASGAGSGHGVGLCQTGALGMARAGRDAKAILLHYYPGVDLVTLY